MCHSTHEPNVAALSVTLQPLKIERANTAVALQTHSPQKNCHFDRPTEVEKPLHFTAASATEEVKEARRTMSPQIFAEGVLSTGKSVYGSIAKMQGFSPPVCRNGSHWGKARTIGGFAVFSIYPLTHRLHLARLITRRLNSARNPGLLNDEDI